MFLGYCYQSIISCFFNNSSTNYLILIKALLSAEDEILAEIKHDLFWENWKTNNQHESTLVQKALSMPNPDQEVLFFFHQCARTFHIMSKFSLHSSKPLANLFDCNVCFLTYGINYSLLLLSYNAY